MEYIRSFVAIELPQEIKSSLKLFQKKFQEKDAGYVKWVEPENIHLTLKFLGNMASTEIPTISQALSLIANRLSPFSLQIDKAGVFPGIKNAQVVWLGVKGELEVLSKLWREVEETLAGLGFEREKRPFVPHLTLARIREKAPGWWRGKFAQLIVSGQFEPMPFMVDAFSLFKSQLTPSGPIYSRLDSFLFPPRVTLSEAKGLKQVGDSSPDSALSEILRRFAPQDDRKQSGSE